MAKTDTIPTHYALITNDKTFKYIGDEHSITVHRVTIFKYYLKHEHECFIRYKTRGAAERFISDKARIASVLNSFKNDPFYTHLVTLFTKEFSI